MKITGINTERWCVELDTDGDLVITDRDLNCSLLCETISPEQANELATMIVMVAGQLEPDE